jgi:hypothetical protein
VANCLAASLPAGLAVAEADIRVDDEGLGIVYIHCGSGAGLAGTFHASSRLGSSRPVERQV